MQQPHSVVAKWVTAAVLGISGISLVVGGFLHPHLPLDEPGQMASVAAADVWAPAHWGITLAQALAIAGVALVMSHLWASRVLPPLALAGLVVVMFGLLLGVLGTLIAATAIKAVADAGNLPLFSALNRMDLGIGWLCILLTTFGGVLVGTQAVATGPRPLKAFGWALAIGSGLFLAMAAALPPDHAWTHEYLLRYAAIGLGLILSAAAVGWPLLIPARATRSLAP